MKHNLGKTSRIVIFLLMGFTLLHAEDFNYSLHVDKKNPYVKEAIVLTLDINQTNPNVVLLFNFDLLKNDNYTFRRLDSKETDQHPKLGLHHAKIRYTYLVYPLHSGKVDLQFKLLKKVTTDESVAYSFSGDRDNIKTLITTNTSIILPALSLHVKSVPVGTQIVGDFTLDFHYKKYQAEAYEPLPLQVTLKGSGYPPILNNILPKDVNFTLFTEKAKVHTHASIQGTQSTVTYAMALSHNKDFTLQPIVIKAFNPLSEKEYTLHIPSQDFQITEINKTMLVDKMDIPPPLQEDCHWLKTLFSYLIVFISGYITAQVLAWQKKPKKDEITHPLIEKIKLSKNEKELLQVLMADNSQRFSSCIKLLESSLYANGKINLRKVKEEALNLV